MTAKTEMQIEGMHCDGCETTVEAALRLAASRIGPRSRLHVSFSRL